MEHGPQSAIKTYLDLINIVDNVPLDLDFHALYKLLLPFDSRPHGFLTADLIAKIPWVGDSIELDHGERTVRLVTPQGLRATDLADACSAALQVVVDAIITSNTTGITHHEHSELYRIIGSCYGGFHPRIERYAAPLFGIASRGAHMTCFVPDALAPHGIKIWIACRSHALFSHPGRLDTSVAGGVKAEDEPLDCITNESAEEASLDPGFVRANARPAGVVTYVTSNPKYGNITPAVIYVYDLELGPDVALTPSDGEVDGFYLWDVDEIKGAMFRGEFKPNSALIMIDFYIRHGIITPEEEVAFADIATRLRRRLPVPTIP